MKIYIVKETTIDEKRVSLVPDVAKKFIKDGFDVFLEKKMTPQNQQKVKIFFEKLDFWYVQPVSSLEPPQS